MECNVKNKIVLVSNDTKKNKNWLELDYICYTDEFILKITYDINLIILKNYISNNTMPYNYDIVESNKNYHININTNINDYKNFYIYINSINKQFITDIYIELLYNDIKINKSIIIEYNPYVNINFDNILFDNMIIDDIIQKNNIISTLLFDNKNYTFSINNIYLDLIKINNSIKLVLKQNINKLDEHYIIFILNITYNNLDNMTINYYKEFNLKINKIYELLIRLDQNNLTYINESCWMTYYNNKLLPVNIDLYKKKNNEFVIIQSDLVIPFFIPKEDGKYMLVIYNIFDKIESEVFTVVKKSQRLLLMEQFLSIFCSR